MWKRILPLALLLSIIFFPALSARAQTAQPILSLAPSAVQIRGVQDKNELSATLTLTPQQAGLAQISFRLDKPLRETSGAARYQKELRSSNLSFTPDTILDPVTGLGSQVTIKAENITEAGTWAGNLTIEHRGTYTGTLSVPITISVQTVPTLSILDSGTILVQGVHGQASPVTRTLTLQETSGGDTVSGISLNERHFLDEKQTLEPPAGFFEGQLASGSEIPRGTTGQAVLTFHLANLSSGRYQGQIAVESDNAQAVMAAVTIEVKDGPVWAWAALIGGIVIGIFLTLYRSSVMPKDQVRVRMQTIQDHLDKDEAFRTYCGPQQVHGLLAQAAGFLRDDKPTEAGASVSTAEQLWDRWYYYRESLTKSLAAAQEVAAVLKAEGQEFLDQPPPAALLGEMTTLLDSQVPEFVPRPAELAARINNPSSGWRSLADHLIACFRSSQALSRYLKDQERSLEPGQVAALTQSLAALDGQFRNLPLQVADVAALQARLSDWQAALRGVLETSLAVRDSYEACRSTAANWLADLSEDVDPVGRIGRYLEEIILAQAEQEFAHREWTLAARTACNAFYGAQALKFLKASIQKYRQNSTEQTWKAVIAEENKLATLLFDNTGYNQESSACSQGLLAQVRALRDALVSVLQQPVELNWLEQLPQPGSKGLETLGEKGMGLLQPLLESIGLAVTYIPPADHRPPGRAWPWESRFWTPGRRLASVHVLTFVIGIGLLAAVGFNELYTKVPAFGVNGYMDYVMLFLWGFGAEAGRAQVVGLVKGWNIITPRAD